ncbi:hypothetical protein U9M48_009465 [Paspalum notatum var. saurae]|uniref:Pentatricopeptide repeat-containing protein n=1 Tax=Paspalum notatum var. saurae TaxID=547442 RepID=A0AAQ3WF30_PASNO
MTMKGFEGVFGGNSCISTHPSCLNSQEQNALFLELNSVEEVHLALPWLVHNKEMAHFGDIRCCGCGVWSNGSAPVIINASTLSLRTRACAVSLDYPTRIEQKDEGNVAVIRPDRRLRDDSAHASAGHGSGTTIAGLKKTVPSMGANPRKLLNEQLKPRRPLTHNSDKVVNGTYFSKHKAECYAESLRRHCNNGKLIQACRVLDEMVLHGQVPDSKCCVRLIRGLARIGKANKGRHVLEIMVLSGGVPDTITCNMLMAQLCCEGQLSSAMEVLEDMRFTGCSPSGITFNTLIRCMCNQHMYDRAVSFWKEQLRMGWPPYEMTSTLLVDLVCKHCGPMRALEVLDELGLEGCQPDVVTYNALISASCKAGCLRDAKVILARLAAEGLEPNGTTYGILLQSLCDKRRWSEVGDLLAHMKQANYEPDVTAYNIFINYLCKYGHLDQAIDVLEMMVSEKCFPDIVTYNTLLNAISKRGMVEEALGIFHSIRENGYRVVRITYNTLIDALAKKGEVITAMNLFDEMKGDGISPDDVTYGSLVLGYCKKNMTKEALDLLNQMLALGFEIKATTFSIIIQALCRDCKVEAAAEVLRVMVSGNVNHSSAFCISIVTRVAKSGQIKEAQMLHQELVDCKGRTRVWASTGSRPGSMIEIPKEAVHLFEEQDSYPIPDHDVCLMYFWRNGSGQCFLQKNDALYNLVWSRAKRGEIIQPGPSRHVRASLGRIRDLAGRAWRAWESAAHTPPLFPRAVRRARRAAHYRLPSPIRYTSLACLPLVGDAASPATASPPPTPASPASLPAAAAQRNLASLVCWHPGTPPATRAAIWPACPGAGLTLRSSDLRPVLHARNSIPGLEPAGRDLRVCLGGIRVSPPKLSELSRAECTVSGIKFRRGSTSCLAMVGP